MSTNVNHEYVEHALSLWFNESDFCVFDLETTDKFSVNDDPRDPKGKVMQIAARRYRVNHDTGQVWLIGEMNTRIADPTMKFINPGALATHGITIEECMKIGTPPKDAWNRFLALADNATLMGQNIIGFDIPFANRELERWGFRRRLPDGRAIDTLPIVKQVWNLGINKLRELANYFGVVTDPALDHDALGDIDTTWQVWMAMQQGVRTYAYQFIRGTPDQYKRRLGSIDGMWADLAA